MHSIYVGDTRYDKKAAKAAKIDFLLAKYGYKIGIKKYNLCSKCRKSIKYYGEIFDEDVDFKGVKAGKPDAEEDSFYKGKYINTNNTDHSWKHAINDKSVSICLIGGVETDKEIESRLNYTARQWETLKSIVKSMCTLYPDAKVIGFNDVDTHKVSPYFDVQEWFDF